MTKLQEEAIEKLKKLTEEEFLVKGVVEYEMKRWEVKELEYGYVNVVIEYGLIGDEGTFAEYLGRNHCHLFIGKRGGVSYYSADGAKKRFKWYSILQAVVDQMI